MPALIGIEHRVWHEKLECSDQKTRQRMMCELLAREEGGARLSELSRIDMADEHTSDDYLFVVQEICKHHDPFLPVPYLSARDCRRGHSYCDVYHDGQMKLSGAEVRIRSDQEYIKRILACFHELGHVIDLCSDLREKPVWKDWLQATEASKTIRQLKASSLLQGKTFIWDGSQVDYVDYCLQDHEIFARFFEQYMIRKANLQEHFQAYRSRLPEQALSQDSALRWNEWELIELEPLYQRLLTSLG